MLTSGHLVDDTKDPYYQPGGFNSKYGNCERYMYEKGENDVAFMEPYYVDKVDYQLASHSGGGKGPIKGVVGKDNLIDNEGNSSYTIYKQGRTSGHQKGYIEEIGTGPELGSIQLTGEANSKDGDSGGPYYRKEDGSYYIAGMNNWGKDNEDGYARGNIMQDIEDNFFVYINY